VCDPVSILSGLLEGLFSPLSGGSFYRDTRFVPRRGDESIFFEWLLLGVALPVFIVYAMLRASR
jgi:hypothetical protein